MCFGGSSGSSQAALNQQAYAQQQQAAIAAAVAQQQAQQRQAALNQGVTRINRLFNQAVNDPQLFDVFQNAINETFLPDLNRQFTSAQRNLKASLGRQGLGRSRTGNQQFASLAQRRAAEEGRLRSEAQSQAGDLRQRIEQERRRALATLYNTQSPSAGLNTAYATLSNIGQTRPEFDPLGDVFQVAALTGARAADSGGFFSDDRSGQFNVRSPRPRQPGRVIG